MAGKKNRVHILAKHCCSHVWGSLLEGILTHPLSYSFTKFFISYDQTSFPLPLLTLVELQVVIEELLLVTMNRSLTTP